MKREDVETRIARLDRLYVEARTSQNTIQRDVEQIKRDVRQLLDERLAARAVTKSEHKSTLRRINILSIWVAVVPILISLVERFMSK